MDSSNPFIQDQRNFVKLLANIFFSVCQSVVTLRLYCGDGLESSGINSTVEMKDIINGKIEYREEEKLSCV